MAGSKVRALACAALVAGLPPGLADPSTEKGRCDFANEPLYPGYFWDETCAIGKVGCLADGKNVNCRFCGGGNYTTPCPPSSCHFPGGDPFVPWYWDNDCEMGMLGCWADGIHAQCRFCGDYPFTSIPCPEGRAAPPKGASCAFNETVVTPHYWEPGCEVGMLGCLADGRNRQCRFCGKGDFAEIPCPASEVCRFAAEPTVPYYFDPDCAMGMLGCNADGVTVGCRFCARRPFDQIPCPEPVEPPMDRCTFPKGSEPAVPYYFERTCLAGMLGCWADGIHAQCRFCGTGVFENVTCPDSATFPRSAGVVARAEMPVATRSGLAEASGASGSDPDPVASSATVSDPAAAAAAGTQGEAGAEPSDANGERPSSSMAKDIEHQLSRATSAEVHPVAAIAAAFAAAFAVLLL